MSHHIGLFTETVVYNLVCYLQISADVSYNFAFSSSMPTISFEYASLSHSSAASAVDAVARLLGLLNNLSIPGFLSTRAAASVRVW
jgi:hypothetical protein